MRYVLPDLNLQMLGGAFSPPAALNCKKKKKAKIRVGLPKHGLPPKCQQKS